MGDAVALWDFDGTLAQRPGLWSGCVLEVLDEHAPGHPATLAGIRAQLKGAFPWNRHERPHPELCEADAWWSALAPMLERALASGGVEVDHRPRLARAVRARFVDAAHGWQLFEDSRRALEITTEAGWRNVVLSNHVPELPQLVRALGLDDLLERVFSSALSGYEKPHPGAFASALAACGEPRRRWMIGDNAHADVAGAEALGIPAVLVRGEGPARRRAPDAAAAAAIVVADGAGTPL